MLRVRFDVNGHQIGELRIKNLGHPRGGHPENDDLRRYEYLLLDMDGDPVDQGGVEHHRSDGFETLVRKVLVDHHEANPQTNADQRQGDA